MEHESIEKYLNTMTKNGYISKDGSPLKCFSCQGKEFKLGSIEVKRFYFDGKIEVNCPECKAKMDRDFSEDYLSYPNFGEEEGLYFYCEDCEKEFEMPGVINATIEVSYDVDKLKEI